MSRFASKSLVALLCALAAPACQESEEGPAAREAALSSMSGLKVVITGADLPHEKVAAISKFVEARAVDTGAALVRMKKHDPGPAELEISLFAAQLPAGDALAGELEAAFPELAGATITTAPAEAGAAGPLPLVEVDHALSPEAAKQEIVEQLQAEGVEGDIDVQVQDGEDGRRIEVKVEKQVAGP